MAIPLPKIQRLLPALLAGLLLLLAGSAFWTGRGIEKHFRHTIGELDRKTIAELEILQYRRGIFSSIAVTALELPRGRARDGTPRWQLTAKHRIRHGPFPLRGASGWGLPARKPLLAAINSQIPLPDPQGRVLVADTTITLGGRAETLLQLAPAAAASGQPTSLGALRGHLLYPADLSGMRGELTLDRLHLELGPYQLALGSLSTVFHYRVEGDGAGEATLGGGQRLAASNLRAGGIEYESLAADLAWHNLDRQALSKLLSLTPWLAEVARGEKPWEISPSAAQTLVEALPRLLSKDPILEISNAALSAPGGQAGGRLSLAYRGQDEDQSRLFHPAMLLTGLELELEAALPPALLGPIADELGTRWQPDHDGNLPAAAEEEPLRLQVSYREGELSINHRSASPQAIFKLIR
ncbi:DUF945 family protein [Desulfurivibrio sp. D14AmB]|uniref:DUF945 family protein n=1 Tax=Desulfurivibrio sp. D14AmB TaxID=3374370 RepID=UPI00376F0921